MSRPIDARVDTPGREGLSGTAPSAIDLPTEEADEITVAPDGRPRDVQPAWRQDFPIDAPLDQYFARREFTKFMVLISSAFMAGQLWIGLLSWRRRRKGPAGTVRIASLGQLPVGGVLRFAYPEQHDACILLRPEERVLVAYSEKCTHLSCAVLPQPERRRIFCPCHEGSFDIATGRPLAGPPRRPLPRILLEIRGDDIYATGVEPRTV